MKFFLAVFLILLFSLSAHAADDIAALKARAEKGNADAQWRLGQMYENGRGVKQDDTEAMKWFREAAERGRADAQNYVGDMYEKGKGVKQDWAEAAKWYRKAADQGYWDAQVSLGLSYSVGLGVPQDYSEAYFWYGVADKTRQPLKWYREEERASLQEEAEGHLTPEQKAAVEKRVTEWKQASRPRLRYEP